MKSAYDVLMVPLEKRGIRKYRKELFKNAKGKILEVGSGTGVNVDFYSKEQLKNLTFSDKRISKHLLRKTNSCCDIRALDVQSLPFEDNSFDTVVHTLVFCSVQDPLTGLKEIRRILKDDGVLIFIEHVLPSKKSARRIFRVINPFWKIIASGCNLTREYEKDLIRAGFEIRTLNKFMNDVFIAGIAKKVTR